jgi:phosphate uptake regulator
MSSARIYVRRIQRVGYSSLSVSLPKRWAKSWGLDKGSRVIIRELPDGTLLLAPESRASAASSGWKALLELPDGAEAEVERGVIALYEAGYDAVKVVAPPSALKALSRLVRRLSGVEVVEEGPGYAVLEVVLDHASLGFGRILDRMASLVRASLEDLAGYAGGAGPESLDRVVLRDDELDKFYFLLVRQASMCFRKPHLLRDLGLSDSAEILPSLYYGKTLERMGDTLVQLAMYAKESGRRMAADLIVRMREAFYLSVIAFKEGEEAASKLAALHKGFFEGRSPAEIIGDPYLSLTGNFLSLCLDVLDARVELEAVKRPLLAR